MLFTTVQRALRAAALALATAAVAACGGSKDISTDVHADAARVQVQGAADTQGASVSYVPLDADTPTVRVARDGNGAPPLPEDVTPAGAVVQLTPLGLAVGAIDIRVPFDATALPAGSTPRLWIATPGEDWAEVADARVDGQALVGRVPMLAHAVVVAHPQNDAAPSRAQAASARNADRAAAAAAPTPTTAQPIAMAASPLTTPALPAPGAGGIIAVTRATDFYYEVEYLLPACAAKPRVRSYVVFVPKKIGTTQPPTRTFELGSFDAQYLRDGFLARKLIGADVNGRLTYNTSAICTETVAGKAVQLKTGFVMDVNIPNTSVTAPAITQAPTDLSVIEGQSAAFSVTASGASLAYQWQRSDSSGANFADVPGATAASTSLTAALADNASLWRVRVSNSAGSVTSIPARLAVVPRAIAPAVSADPRDQSVTEGQTASFTVGASGSPAPGAQWQQRATATAAWSDIAGATALTYTTAATTLAQSGAQYRAVLSNSAGSATSLPATLTVNARLIAPAFTSQPVSQSVQAGNAALFTLTASGSSPLSYQWFKDGVALTGANASELLLPTVAADAGRTFQITARVSNAAGSVTSAAAVLTVTAVPVTGTLIKASEGGFVSANTGAAVEPTLIVPAGALAADATLGVTVESSAVANLPAQIVALGGVINVGPAAVNFSTPATLYLAVPDAVAEGKVLAVVQLEGSASALRTGARIAAASPATATAAAAGVAGNLRRIAASQGKAQGGATILAAGDPLRVLCPDAQAVRGGAVLVDIDRSAVRFVVTEAPQSLCTGNTTTRPRAVIPATTTAPCTNGDFPAVDAGINQVSRHVHCQSGQAETVLSFVPADPSQPTKNFGRYQLQWRIGSDGVADKLNKTYRVKLRLVQLEAGSDALSGLRVMPVYECGADLSAGLCRANSDNVKSLGASGEIEIASTVNFSWDGGDNTFKEFSPQQIKLKLAYTGEDINTVERNVSLSQPPSIRCDKKMAVNRGDGCVYASAPAVMVLGEAGVTKEAAEHIRLAQTNGSRGALTFDSGQYLAASSNALQRTGFRTVIDRNRSASCAPSNSLLVTRPATVSASCATNNAGCQCDEYPYATTWNGAAFDPAGTSVRIIQGTSNGAGGNRHQRFLQSERILDFTDSDTSPPSGENFWVHIE
jgi:hypothetical protein